MQVCSILHVAHVHVRRVIHVIVHYGLTDVEGVLVVVHTFYVAICLLRSHLVRELLYQEVLSLQLPGQLFEKS